MNQSDFQSLANESLNTFAEIASTAVNKLNSQSSVSPHIFASGNTFTGGEAFGNLDDIQQKNRESLISLQHEPAIARLVLEDESGEQRVFYIARKGSLILASGKQLAAYGSPIGRLAEAPVGEERSVQLPKGKKSFTLIEKTNFDPRFLDNQWDSIRNQYRHMELGVFSIESLRALLQAQDIDASDELDRMLEQAETASLVNQGITHQIRIAMGLRDQPILDQFQGDIFRLPLDSQLIILGPPGTGKTTTLIKRLGQKIDLENLEEDESRIASLSGQLGLHASNWLMFTPSDLLKHYLKEAFNKEQVPASDARIKTWGAYRNDIARNTMGILRSANTGRYTLKPDMENLSAEIITDPRKWFELFSAFHDQRLRSQLLEGAEIAKDAAPVKGQAIAQQILKFTERLAGLSWMEIYRELGLFEEKIKAALEESRTVTDDLLKKERNRLYNADKEIFLRMSKLLAELKLEDEPDEEAEFDEDEPEISTQTSSDIQKAVKAYVSALRTLARSRYRKRSMPKASRAARIVDWLEVNIPAEPVLLEIGQRISFQNGLRRFVNAFRRYVADVPASYQAFRKQHAGNLNLYKESPVSPLHLCSTELDAIVLLILRNARELLLQDYIARDITSVRFESLRNLSTLFRTQIMVDEATDFSVIQLACMEALTSLHTRSFFACGDFNQRITTTGIRSKDQLSWVSPRIVEKNITLVYRQSRALNMFSGQLLKLLNGDLSSHGELPKESTHEGVQPVLLENASVDSAVEWIAQRIKEVESSVKLMPTIAVLMNAEEEVKPMAEKLSAHLEAINLRAVACEEGQILGEGADVRVFNVQHIKGLEFEAVFFVGVDRLAEYKPELFDRYLYVGATRAATYLGLVCYQELPSKMDELRSEFVEEWV
ncbi:ATP-binding domain-containing protein [Agitococcus lubricus]|uniref:DNA 3'-5' helicase II n=1 Tax=Agitococcus lubricus TaxID=1077255 RepID=A0A2T5ITH6_9GAMM|nr:ATP-binding domain-containing protein [Agitococcus lubricus]PTQ87167.1 UvrD/REP helicase N-terminal domain-containing protein [Agitococcus lubricus]